MQAIFDFISMLVSGVKSMIDMLSSIPDSLNMLFSFFPPLLLPALIAAVAIVICVRVLELLP